MTITDKDLLARCGKIGASTWSDALDTVGIAGVVQGIPRRGGKGRIVGFATTARHILLRGLVRDMLPHVSFSP